MAIISMTVVSAITGCSQDTDSDTTDIEDRAEYYEKYVDYTSSKATIMNDENTKWFTDWRELICYLFGILSVQPARKQRNG